MNNFKEALKKELEKFSSEDFKKRFMEDCRKASEMNSCVEVSLNGLTLKVRFVYLEASAVILEEHGMWQKPVFRKLFPKDVFLEINIHNWISEKLELMLEDCSVMEKLGYQQIHFTYFRKKNPKRDIDIFVDRNAEERNKDFNQVNILIYGGVGTFISKEELIPWDDGMKNITKIVIPVERKYMDISEYLNLPSEMRDAFA